jgi:hypothetical protein
MTGIDTSCLQECIARYRSSIPGLADIAFPADADSLASLIDSYDRYYPLLEAAMWSGRPGFAALLDCYQSLFREQEALIRRRVVDEGVADGRHHFILSIPVADRPAHLRACLESIWQVCERYGYGGKAAGMYERIRIVVAEDSREADNIRQHAGLVAEYRARGLQAFHFGQEEQYELLHSIPEATRSRLGNILTTQPRERFCRKGQAANRNLSVLKCLQLAGDRDRTLYYFVDSDESFCVNRLGRDGEQAVHALNYFYYIDRIFRGTDTLLLTGRMVGDPPVSPSVMAANFLDDVTAFFADLSGMRGDGTCRFHGQQQGSSAAAGAVYHDMAGLFGYERKHATFPYRCPLDGAHDNASCLRSLAQRLAAFFFGEHLTRKTVFSYDEGFCKAVPARTIYPGNTIASYRGLKYIIPFGHLRLRMSGPTAGRLIAAEIGGRFASANLPHLHRRTNEAGLGDAFRPGVELADDGAQDRIDLSDEFERQFFGDLMLFTTQALVKQADVSSPFGEDSVTAVMATTEQQLLGLYRQKHDAIRARIRRLDELVFHAGHWWLDAPELAVALRQVRSFIDNIDANFGARSPAWQQIRSPEHRAGRKQQILEALLNYRAERDAWDSLFQPTTSEQDFL